MEEIKSKKIKIKLFSDAFPEIEGIKRKSKVHSNVHKLLNKKNINKDKITFRKVQITDLEELTNLHKEWFPIEYDQNYFIKIIENQYNNYINIIAVYNDDNNEYIIGVLFAETKTSDEYNSQVNNDFERYYLFSYKYRYVYIMTIGVIDELRGLKVGHEMLKMLYSQVRPDIVYLHVVEYNKTAIKFYENNGFKQAAILKNFYNIMDNVYDNKVMVKFIERESKLKSLLNYIFCKRINS